MSHDDDEVGGDKLNNFGSEFAGAALGIIAGVFGIAIAVMLLAADLGLGPFFLIAQADTNGIDLNLLGQITPWVFSLALTGLLYGMWETISESYSKMWLKVLAITINVGDTLTDVGGANWLISGGDTSAGQRFWPLAGNDTKDKWIIIGLGAACFLHEPLLGWLLAHYKHAVDPAAEFGEPGAGEKIEKWLVKIAGGILNLAKLFGKLGATFMLPALDLILTPLLIDDWSDQWIQGSIAAGWSCFCTGLQGQLWRRTREMGGIKAAIARSTFDKVMVCSLLVVILIDTYLDIKGYNLALYGETGGHDNIIAVPTQSWAVTIGILIALCSCGELLGREMFTILARKARNVRQANKDGGGFDGGDDEGGQGGFDGGGSSGHGKGGDDDLVVD